MVVLKNIVDFYTQLIGAEGAKTPVGVRFRGDSAGACAEEARRNAHGKRSAWSGNQQTSIKEPNKYMLFYNITETCNINE
jgi:hypothetical protein